MFKLCNPDILPMRSEHSSKSSLTLNYIPKSSLTLNYAAVQHVMLYYNPRPLRWKMTPPMESQTPHQRTRRPRRGN
jgi:hypothetical protein